MGDSRDGREAGGDGDGRGRSDPDRNRKRSSSGVAQSPGDSVHDLIRTQHRVIDGLFGETQRILRGAQGGGPEDGSGRKALEAFGRLERSLQIHFEQEDQLYYPPIAALRPQKGPMLEACSSNHRRFRARLREIRAHLEAGEISEALGALEEFIAAFADHEAAEEAVLASLDGEPAVEPLEP